MLELHLTALKDMRPIVKYFVLLYLFRSKVENIYVKYRNDLGLRAAEEMILHVECHKLGNEGYYLITQCGILLLKLSV